MPRADDFLQPAVPLPGKGGHLVPVHQVRGVDAQTTTTTPTPAGRPSSSARRQVGRQPRGTTSAPRWLGGGMGADDEMPSEAQVRAAAEGRATHPGEPHAGGGAGRLNWLRAAVLGANDGIVSVAGIVVGVAGATAARGPIFTAGLAGLVAGAVSMALGEYVSVSSQRDSELAELAQEKRELARPRKPSWPS